MTDSVIIKIVNLTDTERRIAYNYEMQMCRTGKINGVNSQISNLNNDVEKSNFSAVEKITIVLMNLLHQPISALFHQDIILHIPAVYQ